MTVTLTGVFFLFSAQAKEEVDGQLAALKCKLKRANTELDQSLLDVAGFAESEVSFRKQQQ